MFQIKVKYILTSFQFIVILFDILNQFYLNMYQKSAGILMKKYEQDHEIIDFSY